ncbi:hypothetical protein CGCSCA4_v014013 [Colletotrichum siamense]|uniref:Uncharacterized protein n=1 Tax=Colletotrichum siamense TaxID=690259 RepID=A0A9P5BM07_COLSI|nr:hypothetical protein CGCSCA4_v014013 [Colletotrichum siamense]KAF4843882.1 hypothetical protein CGCSCA2_v014076 [Colletotrichum siamense]
MEAFLDDAEFNSAKESWLLGVWRYLGNGNRFIITKESSRPNFDELQKSRLLGVRPIFHVNQMTRAMVRNRFSPLTGSRLPLIYPAGLLIFPKIDCIEPLFDRFSLESIESILRTQPHHIARFLRSFETIQVAGFHTLYKASNTLFECWPFMFPNLRTMLVETYHITQSRLHEHLKIHDHDELRLLDTHTFPSLDDWKQFEFNPVAPTLKPIWEKKVRLVGTVPLSNSRTQEVMELVQTSQGLRMRMLDPECPSCQF